MNLVLGSEVALLGFWEDMFGILVTVRMGDGQTYYVTKKSPRCTLVDVCYHCQPALSRWTVPLTPYK
jgi:hypothetical protein